VFSPHLALHSTPCCNPSLKHLILTLTIAAPKASGETKPRGSEQSANRGKALARTPSAPRRPLTPGTSAKASSMVKPLRWRPASQSYSLPCFGPITKTTFMAFKPPKNILNKSLEEKAWQRREETQALLPTGQGHARSAPQPSPGSSNPDTLCVSATSGPKRKKKKP